MYMNIFFYIWTAIQIIAESFPISSSGHQLLVVKSFSVATYNFLFSHAVADLLHIPTIAIVITFFWQEIKKLFIEWNVKNYFYYSGLLLLVDSITAFFYFFVIPPITSTICLLLGFTITAFLLYFSQHYTNRFAGFSYVTQAIILGIVQSCACIPGISRLAVTYCTALALGHRSAQSFMIAWAVVLPLLCAATLKSVITVVNHPLRAQLLQPHILLVIIISSMIAWYGFVWFAHKANKQQLKGIALYMVLPILYTCILIAKGK